MPNQYTQVRRKWRDVDPERDLVALWASERFEDPARVHESLRITELAIRVAGWDTVKGWARRELAADRILHAHLVELAMRALERSDGEFLEAIGKELLDRSPASYFRFWLTLFTAKHSHRGEGLFRRQLAAMDDYRIVKYRRWVRKIFRKLRFRCETPRERAIGAIAFALPAQYKPSEHRSEVFEGFFEASKVASTWSKTKLDKPVPPHRQAEIFAKPASALGIWSVVEGLRTSARIPRTLAYLAAMAPRMTDLELRRALRAFDVHLATADHKKASEQVVETATYLRDRCAKMDVPLEEWCKIHPYAKSPVLVRLLEELIGERMDRTIAKLQENLQTTFVPVLGTAHDARAFRIAFLLAYLLHRTRASSPFLLDAGTEVRALMHSSALWPYGVGQEPPARRWQEQPDHPHRVGLTLMREHFPAVAKQLKPSRRPLDATLRALRWHLYCRALIDRESSAEDVPVVFLTSAIADEERRALAITLRHFAAAVLVRFEERWDEPLDAPNVVHLELPRDLERSLAILSEAMPKLESARASFASRKAEVDREARRLLLVPPPGVRSLVRMPDAT